MVFLGLGSKGGMEIVIAQGIDTCFITRENSGLITGHTNFCLDLSTLSVTNDSDGGSSACRHSLCMLLLSRPQNVFIISRCTAVVPKQVAWSR